MEGCEAAQGETGEAELRRGRFRVQTLDSEGKMAGQTNKSEGRVKKRSDGMGGVGVGGGVDPVGHRQQEIMAVIGKKRKINAGHFFSFFSSIFSPRSTSWCVFYSPSFCETLMKVIRRVSPCVCVCVRSGNMVI